MILAAVILTISAGWVTLIGGSIIPLVTGVITKLEASTGVKSFVTIFLALVLTVCTALVQDNGILTTETGIQALTTWGIALLSFYGVWSPLNTDSKLAPGFGVG